MKSKSYVQKYGTDPYISAPNLSSNIEHCDNVFVDVFKFDGCEWYRKIDNDGIFWYNGWNCYSQKDPEFKIFEKLYNSFMREKKLKRILEDE